MKIVIQIEEIMEMQKRRKEINSIPFENIIFTKNNIPIEISESKKKKWKFSGLNNTDFWSYRLEV